MGGLITSSLAGRRDTHDLRRFLLLCGLFALVVSVPALIQLTRTGGYLYYRNGVDEALYLQYGVSVRTEAMSRPGQYLVTGLHRAGLSGGYINVLLDATLPCLLLLLVRAIGLTLGLTERAASECAFLFTLGPLFFNAANPLVEILFNVSAASGAIRYVAVPNGLFLPVLRSPEPQFSLVLLGAATLLALRWRSFIPVYGILPFLYPFIALPAAFVTIGLTIHALLGSSSQRRDAILSVVTAYIILAVGAGVMLILFVNRSNRQLLVPSHMPIVSTTTMAAMIGWLGLRRRLEPQLDFCARLVALAPLAACNIHLVTGWLAAPTDIEMYAGGPCAALLCGCALFAPVSQAGAAARWQRAGSWLALVVLVVMTALVVRVMAANVREVFAAPLVGEPVLEALRTDAARVVWSDGRRTRLLALVFPRQKATALDYEQTQQASDPAANFERYLSVRRAILDDPRSAAFQQVLAALDAGYTHENEENFTVTSGRQKQYWVNRNVPREAAGSARRATDLIYLVERADGRLEIDR